MPILNALLLLNNKRYRNHIFTAFKHVLWHFIVDETDRLIVWLAKVKHDFFSKYLKITHYFESITETDLCNRLVRKMYI
jgi:hypothetical protein